MSFAIEALEAASAFIVNGGPILGDYDLDDERLVFSWIEHEGSSEVVVSRTSLENAVFRGSSFFVSDEKGEDVEVELFTLRPTYPVPPSFAQDLMGLFKKMDEEGVAPQAVMEPCLDSMVDTYVGGGDGDAVNSQGREQQLIALYAAFEGDVAVLAEALAFRLSCLTGYGQSTWKAVLIDPGACGLVKDALGEPWAKK